MVLNGGSGKASWRDDVSSEAGFGLEKMRKEAEDIPTEIRHEGAVLTDRGLLRAQHPQSRAYVSQPR